VVPTKACKSAVQLLRLDIIVM